MSDWRKPACRILSLLLTVALPGHGAVAYLEAGLGERQGAFGTPVKDALKLGYASLGGYTDQWNASLTLTALDLSRSGPGPGDDSRDRGLGDAVLRGGTRLLPETWDGWSVDGLCALKVPTASKDRGLGTGRADLGAYLSLNQQLGLFSWTVTGGWSQGVSGEASGNLTPGEYALSATACLALEGARVDLTLETRGPSYQGQPGARELWLSLAHTLSPAWTVKGTAMAGFTNASPRWDLGLAVVRTF